MQIIVKIKNVYGIEKIYPVCETANRLAALSVNKTLTREAIKLIKELGYTIKIEQQEL